MVQSDMSDSAWLNVITQYCTVNHLIAIELAILPLDFWLQPVQSYTSDFSKI